MCIGSQSIMSSPLSNTSEVIVVFKDILISRFDVVCHWIITINGKQWGT